MGGQNKQTQTTQSTTQPWQAAQPALNSILSGIQSINPTVTPTQTSALDQIEANAGRGNPFAGNINSLTSNLFNGGGATSQSPLINSAYSTYANSLQPFTNPAFLDPRNTPGFADALSATNSDITNQINGMFAGAGRDLSGANTQALARGLSQGEGQLIANQYNQNVNNQLGAANSLYGAGNNTAGLLTGLNQQGLANQQAGIGTAQNFLDAQNYGPNAVLAAEAQRTGIPLSILSGLANIATPIGSLGRDTTGTTTTTQAANPMQALIGAGIAAAGLLSGNPMMALGGAGSAFGGLGGGGANFGITQANPSTWIPAPYG